MKSILALLLLVASTLCFAEPKITLFIGLTPAGSFQGVSKKPKGNLFKTGSSFTADKISVSIESFKTGIDLRDEHLWKHMSADKHPKATLSDLKATGGKATANLEVNGVTKPIKMTYVEKGSEIEAKFSVKASAFNMPQAKYLGVGVNDDIPVEAILPFKAK
jgi:polyisoprenoid-binding protein YceI